MLDVLSFLVVVPRLSSLLLFLQLLLLSRHATNMAPHRNCYPLQYPYSKTV